MTDQTKFEEMLEKLVNEDRDGAEALFHEIVVEKSREIYQNILDEADEEVEETTDEEVDESDDEDLDESDDEDLDEATDEEVDESDDEDLDESDDDLDEMFGLDEPEMEADQAMDMMKDIEGGDEEGGDMDMGDEGDEEAEGPEEAMADLEDALEALKAEFEKMMGDEEPGDEEPGDEEPEEEAMAFEADDEEVDEATDEEVDEAADEEVEESKAPKTASEEMREYVEKITPNMGDNGANTKSIVAGANDMGGTAGNIAQSGADEKGGTGASAPKEDNAGNVNTPGGKASKSMKSQPGHGAEKKGKPESADKGAGSPLNGAPKRAK
jgi:hypothetical protein